MPVFTRLGLDGTSWGTSRDHVAPSLHLCEKIRIVFERSIDCVLMAEGWIFKLEERHRLDLPVGTARASAFGRHGVVCWETQWRHALDKEPA